MAKHKVRRVVIDFVFVTVGSIVFAIGMQMFAVPNQIAPGGVSGLAVALNYLTGVSVGTWSFLINIPLLLLGYFLLGKHFTLSTLVSVTILSAIMNIVELMVPAYSGDILLASLFSGVLIGAGLALVFLRGSTTGGTDIISRLIQRRHPHMPMGKLMLAIDVVVILFSALVFRKIEVVLYSLVTVYISAHTIDSVLYGVERGKLVYIVSSNAWEIADKIMQELDRGCTMLKGIGCYTRAESDIVMIALRRQQYHLVKEIAHETDPNSFLIVTDSAEVLGEGFKPIKGHHS